MQKITPYLTLIIFLGICIISCSTEPLHAPYDVMVVKTKINTG